MPEPKLDPGVLKTQESLTEDQSAAIALEVLQEEEAAAGDKKPDAPSLEETQETEEQKADRIKAEEEAKPKADAEAKKPVEEPTQEEKDAAAKEAEAAKLKAETDQQKEIEAYATEQGVTVEEAKEDFEHVAKIQDKYKNDPKHLAQANLHIQRLYTKTQEELKTLKTAPVVAQIPQPDVLLKAIEEGKLTVDGKAVSKQEAIDAFRANNPKLESVDDEVVLDLMVKDLQRVFEAKSKDDAIKVSAQAKEKREKLLSALPEADKRFSGELKTIIDKISDSGVAREEFNLEPYIAYAKGKVYDKDLKEAEDRGYKRGLEKSTIIAKRSDGPVGAGAPGDKGNKTPGALTDAQKQEALEMFSNYPDVTDEKKIEMFKEILADEAKKKSNGGK